MSKPIVFGTDGWRDIIADGFTFANVRLVTQAIAEYVVGAYGTDRPVLVGHDPRFLARDFALAACGVLRANGLTPLLVDRDVPTPVIAFHALHRNSAGAVQFTASHNPPAYCGIKYIPDYAGPATKDITDKIVGAVNRMQAAGTEVPAGDATGVKTFDPMPEYLADVKKRVDLDRIRAAKLQVVYDPLYGTGRGYLDRILTEAGCQVKTLHDAIDPLFGGGMPEPAPKYLEDLVARVRSEGANLGLATDGDADRFGVVDEAGRYFWPNQVIALLLRHLVKNRGAKGSVVRTVATTTLIDKLAEQYGVPVRETPVGFKWVGEKMRQEAVIIGGEESGGLSILGHIPEKDGILADLLIAEMVAFEGKPLSAIWTDLVAEARFEPANKRLDLHLTQRDKDAVLAFFAEHPPAEVGGVAVASTSKVDGTKFQFADGSWMLARPSGTEPIIRIYLEANGADALAKLEAAVQRLVDAQVKEPVGAGH